MGVHWLTAFIDHSAASAGDELRFWQVATNSALSARRGDRGQFATFVPSDGDAFLRVQETDSGDVGVHLDLHVDSVDNETIRSLRLGSTLIDRVDDGLAVMRSPRGMTFCLVQHHGEAQRPSPVEVSHLGVVYLLDQISIDIPHDAFDDECRFWSDLTGWPIHGGSVPEFRVLQRPDGMALRILLQRLDDDDPATLARAHLDFAVGEHGDAIAAWHQTLGATFARQGRRWITLTDPAGLPYCLTERDPVTGTL